VLGDHKVLYDLWRERRHLWRVWRRAAKGLELGDLDARTADAALGNAARDLLHKNNVALRKLATALVRWDGTGDLPAVENLPEDFVRVPLPPAEKRQAYAEWQEHAQESFEREVAKELE
jgi:hypothetical protein